MRTAIAHSAIGFDTLNEAVPMAASQPVAGEEFQVFPVNVVQNPLRSRIPGQGADDRCLDARIGFIGLVMGEANARDLCELAAVLQFYEMIDAVQAIVLQECNLGQGMVILRGDDLQRIDVQSERIAVAVRLEQVQKMPVSTRGPRSPEVVPQPARLLEEAVIEDAPVDEDADGAGNDVAVEKDDFVFRGDVRDPLVGQQVTAGEAALEVVDENEAGVVRQPLQPRVVGDHVNPFVRLLILPEACR